MGVIKFRADLGICLDGDGDRVAIVDQRGSVVDGDRLIGILAKFMIDTNQLGSSKEIVGTVMSNFGLEKYINSIGGSFYRSKVGDRYIVERMLTSKSVFGGEPSGHIIFKNFSTTGDGILAALKVIECLKYYNKSLDELLQDVQLVPQVLKNIIVKEKKDFDSIPALKNKMNEIEAQMKNSGRILLRYSGTENLARVMVEGENRDQVESACQELADIVQKEIGA